MLDLHNSGQDEIVIDILALLSHALPVNYGTGVFRMLYYADEIISCLYNQSGPDPMAWLIAFHQKSRQILVTKQVESIERLFVRHNKQYLCFGTHSEVGADGHNRWVIHGFNFESCRWFP